jgi:RNA polymerase sigma-70 factor (ECF subfamily)
MVKRPLDPDVLGRLHRKANASRWGVTPDRFAEALESSVAHAHPDAPAGRLSPVALAKGEAVESYLVTLRLDDLALAVACADGNEAAWDHFIREHRPVLYRAADAIDKTGSAREAADALYGELFGLTEREGERRSLFRYFHGRSSLATWLRAVLSQRYVDGLRRTRRLDPLPAEDPSTRGPTGSLRAGAHGALLASADSQPPERARFLELMRQALTAAVTRLEPRDRLRLACYYAQSLTLVQIGRTLREHEATTSRHLARTRRAIREDVERQLRQGGMGEAEVEECFASVVDDAGSLDLAEILPARKSANQDRST